jgi:Asp-tRNA(Asn)/Glu-tRNA(Gln) amidotransferase A subunit family amidase
MPPTSPTELTAAQAASMIATKALSPVELTDACIQQVEAIDPAVNALIARDFDVLRDAARTAEQAVMTGKALGPLHGLPFGVKDMIDVAGLPTTFGSEAFRDNLATSDDRIVTAMRAAGALPLGKTNNPEWSAGGNTRNKVYGATANPYDLTKTCAGSSGGSAVSLACRYAPLATGSDTGGSLRNPAAFCGVVGFRPSPGVVPGNTRAVGLVPMSTSGPMARTVQDAGLMLSVLARADRDDPYTTVIDGRTPWAGLPFANPPAIDLKSLRFAVTEDYGFAPTEHLVRRQFQKAMGLLTDDLGPTEQATPDCADADRIFAVLRGVQFLGVHARLYDETPNLVGPNVADNVREGRSYSAEDVAQALFAQSAYHRRWQAFFDQYDYILSPAVTISPRPWRELFPDQIDGTPTQSYYHWLAMAYASTIPGHPSITIPCGLDENGMPFGLQIVGKRHDDLGVLSVAAQLESLIGASDLALPAPDFQSLQAAPPLRDAPEFLTFD